MEIEKKNTTTSKDGNKHKDRQKAGIKRETSAETDKETVVKSMSFL